MPEYIVKDLTGTDAEITCNYNKATQEYILRIENYSFKGNEIHMMQVQKAIMGAHNEKYGEEIPAIVGE
jgi:hypothetical protein